MPNPATDPAEFAQLDFVPPAGDGGTEVAMNRSQEERLQTGQTVTDYGDAYADGDGLDASATRALRNAARKPSGIALTLDTGMGAPTAAQPTAPPPAAATPLAPAKDAPSSSLTPEFFNAMGDLSPAMLDLIRSSTGTNTSSSGVLGSPLTPTDYSLGTSLKLDLTDPLTFDLTGAVPTLRGAAYRESQVVDWSHYDDPLDTSDGRLAGNSRIWGDASAATQNASIEALINSAASAGLTTHQTAMVLAIAHTESGFNPDAAAGTTSASGLGQFVDKTGEAYSLNDNNRWDVNAQADSLVMHFLDNQAIAQSRGQGDEYIYKYHHDGPSSDYGGLSISTRVVMPLVNTYETILNRGY